MSRETPKKRFRRLGGSYQLVLESASDLALALDLDESQWAVTSVPIDSLVCDKEFLSFVDDDANGRIRTDEVRRAIEWTLSTFKDLSGVDRKSEILLIESLDLASSDGLAVAESARIALQSLGLDGSSEISLDQIRSRQTEIVKNLGKSCEAIASLQSEGPPSPLLSFLKGLGESMRKRIDTGGKEGIDKEALDKFLKEAEAPVKWLEESLVQQGGASSAVMPFGEETHEIYRSFAELKGKIDEFFACCDALRMASGDSARRFAIKDDDGPSVDPMDAKAMSGFLEGAPLAEPSQGARLPLEGPLNPLWTAKLSKFRELAVARACPGEGSSLSFQAWKSLKASLDPYGDWLARKKPGILDPISPQSLPDYVKDGLIQKLRAMLDEELAVSKEMKACDKLRKLILFQANLLEFANNFVSLTSLFNPQTPSMIQAGRLVMDGRHFTLATKVSDIDEHKKVAVKSDICIMYLDLSTGAKDKLKSMRIAVAVTSGFMRNLYVGKNGVFLTPDGLVWDAKVADLLSQPVSFSESLRLPFYKLGEFLGKQADRFFSTKGKEIESSLATQTSGAPAPAQQAPQQAPAVSGSMLLMGGGVGIAAIGTSFAFIAQSLGNISLKHLLAVFLAAMLIFGGPVVAVSVYKLWRRNIAMFLEASGWALNDSLRMTRKMGLIFTHKTPMPLGAIIAKDDLLNPFFKALDQSRVRRGKALKAVALALCYAALFGFGFWLWTSHLASDVWTAALKALGL